MKLRAVRPPRLWHTMSKTSGPDTDCTRWSRSVALANGSTDRVGWSKPMTASYAVSAWPRKACPSGVSPRTPKAATVLANVPWTNSSSRAGRAAGSGIWSSRSTRVQVAGSVDVMCTRPG